MSNNKSSKCFAPGCNSGYASNTEKVSLFKAPRNPEDREKWNSIIARPDRNLQPTDVICEKHFHPDDIIKNIEYNNIIIPYKRPRLKAGAAPKLFLDSPAYLTKNIRKGRIIYGIEKNISQASTSTNEQFIKTESKEVCSTNQELIEEDNNIFLKLYYKNEILSLDECWGIFPCEKNNIKYLLYSQMTVKNNTPVMGKQVIVFDNLDITFFCGSNQITNDVPALITSKEDLETSINLFSKLKFCSGGPSSKMYEDVVNITECAYIDYSSASWRHKNCPITMTSENLNICEYCNSLWSRFNRNLLSKNKTRKRIRCKAFGLKFANNAMKKNAVEKYKQNRNSSRLETKFNILKTKLCNLEEKFKKLTQADFNDRIENLNIPEEQKRMIKESISCGKI